MNAAGKTLSFGEQKWIEQRIQELKDARGGKELIQGVNFESPNKKMVDREIAKFESVLATQGIHPVSDSEKVEKEKEKKLLEEDLRKGMPRWDVYAGSVPKDGARHDKIVNWISDSNNDPVRQQKIRRWKTLARQLDPDHPKASHVMNLFPA